MVKHIAAIYNSMIGSENHKGIDPKTYRRSSSRVSLTIP